MRLSNDSRELPLWQHFTGELDEAIHDFLLFHRVSAGQGKGTFGGDQHDLVRLFPAGVLCKSRSARQQAVRFSRGGNHSKEKIERKN